MADFQRASHHLHCALDIEIALRGKDSHTNISKIWSHLALLHQHWDNTELALEYFQHALKIDQQLLPPEHTCMYIGLRLEQLGSCHEYRAEYELALEYYQRALIIAERTLPTYHKLHRDTLVDIINALDHLGAYEQAIEFALRKLDIDQPEDRNWTMERMSGLYLQTKMI